MELRTSRLVAWLRSVQVLGWLTSGWLGEYFCWSISELGPRFVELFERTAGLVVGRTGLKGALIVAALAEVTRSLPDSFPAAAEVPLLFFDRCWWGSTEASPCKECHIALLLINVRAQSRSKYGRAGPTGLSHNYQTSGHKQSIKIRWSTCMMYMQPFPTCVASRLFPDWSSRDSSSSVSSHSPSSRSSDPDALRISVLMSFSCRFKFVKMPLVVSIREFNSLLGKIYAHHF